LRIARGYPRVACELAEYEWIVLLDAAIEIMRQMEVDMMSKYKKISLGGLPINLVEC
jgi:L-serine deaminase